MIIVGGMADGWMERERKSRYVMGSLPQRCVWEGQVLYYMYRWNKRLSDGDETPSYRHTGKQARKRASKKRNRIKKPAPPPL